jgi:hypothetical protein
MTPLPSGIDAQPTPPTTTAVAMAATTATAKRDLAIVFMFLILDILPPYFPRETKVSITNLPARRWIRA